MAQARADALRMGEEHRSNHILAELDKISLEVCRVTTDVSLGHRCPSDSEWSPNQSTSSGSSESEGDDIVQRYFEDTSIFGQRMKARCASPRFWGAVCVPPVGQRLTCVRCGRLASKLRKVEKLLDGPSTEAGTEASTGDASSEEQLRKSQACSAANLGQTNDVEDAPAASISMPRNALNEPKPALKGCHDPMSKIVWRDARQPTAAGPGSAGWKAESLPVFRQAPDLPKISRQDCGAAAISGIKWRENSDITRKRDLTLGCKLDVVTSSDTSGKSPQAWVQEQLASSNDRDGGCREEADEARNKPWTEARKYSALGEHVRGTRNFSEAFNRSREKLVTSEIAAALLADE